MISVSFRGSGYTNYQTNTRIKDNKVKYEHIEQHNRNQKQKKSKLFKILAPVALASIIGLGNINSCSERISDSDVINGTTIEYINVEKETRDSISKPLFILKSKLNKNNDFLKDVDINIVKNYKDLDDSHSFKTYLKSGNINYNEKAISFYSDNKLKKMIVVQEKAHDNYGDKLMALDVNGQISSIPSMRMSLMHEVGHQFDEYFGHDHNSKFAKDWDNLMYKKELDSENNPYSFDLDNNENIIYKTYNKKSGLSDSKEFKEAMLKDLRHIAKLKEMKTRTDSIPCSIDYFTPKIDYKKPITTQHVESADDARAEAYANLFSYAIGENDGDKNYFLNAFSNSYKVVCKDIEKYLGKSIIPSDNW